LRLFLPLAVTTRTRVLQRVTLLLAAVAVMTLRKGLVSFLR
jgi:hypothetical protein